MTAGHKLGPLTRRNFCAETNRKYFSELHVVIFKYFCELHVIIIAPCVLFMFCFSRHFTDVKSLRTIQKSPGWVWPAGCSFSAIEQKSLERYPWSLCLFSNLKKFQVLYFFSNKKIQCVVFHRLYFSVDFFPAAGQPILVSARPI